jgi:hypothetical protein
MTKEERAKQILELNKQIVDLMKGRNDVDIPLAEQNAINAVKNRIHVLQAGGE